MPFADPPASPPAPAYEVIRFESASAPAARRDTPLIYARGAQAERAILRHQIFLRTEVEARKPKGAAAGGDIECAWVIVAFLQRVPCLESITGQLACGEDWTSRIGDQESGRAQVAADQQASCGLAYTPIAVAQARLANAVSLNAPAVFDEDLAKRVKPELRAAGITVRPPTATTPRKPAKK
jgi:hypothetical protein